MNVLWLALGFAIGWAIAMAYGAGRRRERRRAYDAMEEAFAMVPHGPMTIACVAMRIRWQLLMGGRRSAAPTSTRPPADEKPTTSSKHGET